MSRPLSKNAIKNAMLDDIQRDTFKYFLNEVNPDNGLVADKTKQDWPASIAAVGMALSAYPVAVKRGLIERKDAVQRTLTTLRFFWSSPQGMQPDATGYKGFYYHFLDMKSGQRAWSCELSTIDTAILVAGMLAAAQYFSFDLADEWEIRLLADKLYRRVDWQWAIGSEREATVALGWKPESGFLPYQWHGYSEGLLLYLLGLGSPTFALPEESYQAFTSTYEWREVYDIEYLYAGPLFIHQLTHLWIDFRGVQDSFMRSKGSNYFENARRAAFVQQQYAIHNPHGFEGYSEECWGITASDGPGPRTLRVDGVERHFYGYEARGVTEGPDDGTIAPWVVVSSLPFAPEIVLPAIRHFNSLALGTKNPYGFKASFNQTYPNSTQMGPGSKYGWVSPYHYGINQGPITLAIENYRSGLIWRLMCECPYIVKGLKRAGFTGGWLDTSELPVTDKPEARQYFR